MAASINDLIALFAKQHGTDLYLTVDSKPQMRGEDDQMRPLSDNILTNDDIKQMLTQLIGAESMDEFESTLEFNSAINWQNTVRMRLNAFKQRQQCGIVLRRIRTDIPSVAELLLPKPYADLAMEKRGLVLIVGPTGSGKSTSMAAMIGHRNERAHGHIVTVEDPVEFIHDHKQCIVTQRDVGIDTYSYGIALKNVLRQRPDVIVIGEIRDRDTMDHAIMFSETGHLCIATLHAGNVSQALERIINFFPEEKHHQVMLSLSINLRGILCQRLVVNQRETRSMANEIMLNHGLIKNLIQEGRLKEVHGMIEKSRDQGMVTFDQSLLDLLNNKEITESVAYAEADNPANLRLQMTQKSMSQRLGYELKDKPQF